MGVEATCNLIQSKSIFFVPFCLPHFLFLPSLQVLSSSCLDHFTELSTWRQGTLGKFNHTFMLIMYSLLERIPISRENGTITSVRNFGIFGHFVRNSSSVRSVAFLWWLLGQLSPPVCRDAEATVEAIFCYICRNPDDLKFADLYKILLAFPKRNLVKSSLPEKKEKNQ